MTSALGNSPFPCSSDRLQPGCCCGPGLGDPWDSKAAQAQTYAVGIPGLQAKLIQVRNQLVTEESAGSSYLVPAV